ncbi:Ppx/GppA family phosphatase [Bacillus dakarensis]|uniref:Ppx/GppA family phosphatase n=1 Tax=Robertmurraya dakarensis TaxID=1926278 RepID=UPI000981C773|nr:Ppx/GppA family phosphatase [Bacillus dakarensis]
MIKNNRKTAIIDIGSNTIRLVIYNKNEFGKFKETENIKAAARLRRHLNQNGYLEEEGMLSLLKILKGFKEILDFHKVKEVKCVATAAIRQALNKKEITQRVKTETGFDVTILTENEEAYFGYFAVIHTTPIADAVTIDIGGGSTEITYFKDRELQYSHSFPFGVVSLSQQFINGDKITAVEKKQLQNYIVESFKTLPWLKDLNVPIIAIGGSARNVAQVHQNLKNYPLSGIHQYSMSLQDLQEVLSLVEGLHVDQLAKLEGLAADRADIILPAIEVFVELTNYVESDTFLFSRKGLRDGIFLKEYKEQGDRIQSEQIAGASIDELVHHYGIQIDHSKHVSFLAKQIYQQISQLCQVGHSEEKIHLVDLSARVYYLGEYVDSDVSSQHTFYLLANTSIEGLLHKDRLKLALIASFKNNTLLKQYYERFHDWFSKEEFLEIRVAGAITKLAAALDASKRGIIKAAHLQMAQDGKMEFILQCSGDVFVEKYQAEKQVRHLMKAIKKDIHLTFRNL